MRDIEAIFVAYNANARKVNAELTRKEQRWGRIEIIGSPANSAQVVLDAFNTGQVERVVGKKQNPLLLFQSEASEQFRDMLKKYFSE